MPKSKIFSIFTTKIEQILKNQFLDKFFKAICLMKFKQITFSKNINEVIMFNILNNFKNNQMRFHQNLIKQINFINEILISIILLKISNFSNEIKQKSNKKIF